MKKTIAILTLFLVTLTAFSQTRFGRGIKLYNASEITDFSGGYEHIPVMKTNGFINRYIHSDSLVLQSQIKNLGIDYLDAQGVQKYTTKKSKKQGYYDVTNEVYYPNIKENTILDIVTIEFDRDNYQHKIFNNNSGGGGGVSDAGRFVPLCDENADIFIKGYYREVETTPFFIRLVKVNNVINIEEAWVSFGNDRNINIEVKVVERISDNKIFVGIKSLWDVQGNYQGGYFIESVTMKYRQTNYDVMSYYNSFDEVDMFNGQFAMYNVLQRKTTKDLINYAKPVALINEYPIPTQSAFTGVKGDIRFSENSMFICTATNNWEEIPYGKDVKTIQAGTNITIDNTNPQQPIINATGGTVGATDLGVTTNSDTITVTSSSGNDVVLPLATTTTAGLQKANFYQEGEFTPAFRNSNGGNYNIGASYSRYVRIGNIVHVYIRINSMTNGTVSNVSGSFYMSGIPFPVSVFEDQHMASLRVDMITANYNNSTSKEVLFFQPAVSNEFLLNDINFNAITGIDFGTVASGVDFIISGTYKTNVYTP